MFHFTSQIETLKEASINTWGVPLIIGEGARDTTEVTRKFMKMAFSDESPVVAVLLSEIIIFIIRECLLIK